MKYIEEYLREQLLVQPLGTVTVCPDKYDEMQGNYVYINNKCTDIFVAYADYSKWIEDKYTKAIDKLNKTK